MCTGKCTVFRTWALKRVMGTSATLWSHNKAVNNFSRESFPSTLLVMDTEDYCHNITVNFLKIRTSKPVFVYSLKHMSIQATRQGAYISFSHPIPFSALFSFRLFVLDHHLSWDLPPTNGCTCLSPDVLDLDLSPPGVQPPPTPALSLLLHVCLLLLDVWVMCSGLPFIYVCIVHIHSPGSHGEEELCTSGHIFRQHLDVAQETIMLSFWSFIL